MERYQHRHGDWYVISAEQAKSIGSVPGITCDERRGLWLCHRTHLPLLDIQLTPLVLPASSSGYFGDGVTTLYPHQVTGVNYIRSRSGTLLADMMRTGKTPTIVASHEPEMGPLVVVGPLATRGVWCGWFKRRWPDIEPIVLTGRTYDPDQFGDDPKVMFIHYDILPYWVSIGFRYRVGTLVFDEGHVLAKAKSRWSQNAVEIVGGSERVIMATGTPLYNKPASIYNLLASCAPAAFGSYWDFTERYCSGHPGSHGWETGDPSNVDEFRQRLEQIMLRREWGKGELSDVLPATDRKIERAPISSAQCQELDLIAAALNSETDELTVIGQMARYRKLVGTAKAEPAAALARTKSRTGPVVIWVWHKLVAKRVAEELPTLPHWIITSDTPEKKREAILDQWRQTSDGVLIMSMSIGGAGIDLSHSRQCIFAELDWTPAIIGQAEMRTFSPLRPDEVTYVVAEHEIDERLVAVLAEKCARALVMGTPAADTAIDVLGQILSGNVGPVDLDDLAERMLKQVRDEGTTFV